MLGRCFYLTLVVARPSLLENAARFGASGRAKIIYTYSFRLYTYPPLGCLNTLEIVVQTALVVVATLVYVLLAGKTLSALPGGLVGQLLCPVHRHALNISAIFVLSALACAALSLSLFSLSRQGDGWKRRKRLRGQGPHHRARQRKDR